MSEENLIVQIVMGIGGALFSYSLGKFKLISKEWNDLKNDNILIKNKLSKAWDALDKIKKEGKL